MCYMRILFFALLIGSTQACAELAQPVWTASQPAWSQTVAKTQQGRRIVLLRDSCGWPGGAMRAQWIRPNDTMEWGCWGYTETGVQIQWAQGQHQHVDYADLAYWTGQDTQSLNFKTLHQRVWLLRNK